MKQSVPQTLSLKGHLVELTRPLVMGILNITPDSFFAGSRTDSASHIRQRIRRMVSEGVDIFDIGGYSSRPGADDISPDEEYSRLALGLEILRGEAPEVPVSVDTFRSIVALRCVREWGVDIINDISGGQLDAEMWPTVAELGCGYVLMHMRGTPATMQALTDYTDVTAEVLEDLARKVAALRSMGVADIIVDPGYGFAKTTEQNFRLLRDQALFRSLRCPILTGISRKSMIFRTLGISPEESLNGTTVLNTISLLGGADILRVHDVKEAREAIALVSQLRT